VLQLDAVEFESPALGSTRRCWPTRRFSLSLAPTSCHWVPRVIMRFDLPLWGLTYPQSLWLGSNRRRWVLGLGVKLSVVAINKGRKQKRTTKYCGSFRYAPAGLLLLGPPRSSLPLPNRLDTRRSSSTV